MAIDFYHNPRCTTSRKALQLLRERGIEPNIIEYLKTPPDRVRLEHLLKLLKMKPSELLRRREKAAIAEAGLDLDEPDEEAVIEAMVAQPILIERPIIVHGEKARLGRPAEKVLEAV